MPDLARAVLNIGGETFSFIVENSELGQITLLLPEEAIGGLKYPVPVMLQWEESEYVIDSNPIYVCNRAGLKAVMETEVSDEKISRAGGLDLDDEELEQLVRELESHMVIDRQSIWQVIGKQPPAPTSDEDALRLDYADIDYEMLRQHPKIRQYTAVGQLGSGYGKTRLQMILGSITDHFQGLVDFSRGEQGSTTETIINSVDTVDTEEEAEQEEEEKQKRQRTGGQRLRHIFKQFVRRYLHGIASPDFQELAGYEVMTNNYIIFSNLLWALFRKEWFEPESQFLIESFLKTWEFFWGKNDTPGYYRQQEAAVQAEMLELVEAYHADAQLLASLCHCAALTHQLYKVRLALRNFWRYLMDEPPFSISNRVLEETWIYVADVNSYNPPRPSEIVKELYKLARFETEANFLRSIENKFRLPQGGCFFDRVTVRRDINYRPVDMKVKCLFIQDPENTLPQKTAVSLLKTWMCFETLDYYRISFITVETTKKLLVYEPAEAKGIYWNEALGIDEDIDLVTASDVSWTKLLTELESIAKTLNSTLTFPIASVDSYANIGSLAR